MPKSKREKNSEWIQQRRYQWEFLRRSDRYMQNFERYSREYSQWIKTGFDPAWLAREALKRGEDPRTAPKNSFFCKAIEAHQKFRKTFGIDPTDPNDAFSPVGRLTAISVIDYGPATEEWARTPGVITLCINTQAPIGELLDYLEWRIRYEKRESKRTSQVAQPHRQRPQDYPGYLEAYDMQKSGKTMEDIAARLKITVQTAKRFCNRAEQLILHAERGEWP